MSDRYVLYSVRGGGWFTKAANTHSDLSMAERYTREGALKLVRLHRGRYAPFGLLPIDLDLLEEAAHD